MASIDLHPSDAVPAPVVAPAAPATWGNSAPLALAAFAVTTFILSMVNSGIVNIAVLPVIFGVALMFGGLTQLIAAFFQFRIGNTFGGVLRGRTGRLPVLRRGVRSDLQALRAARLPPRPALTRPRPKLPRR